MIHVVKTERDEWSEKCVKQLEDALQHAKETPLKSVLVISLSHAGNIDLWYSTMGRLEFLGALEHAKTRVSLTDD